MKAGIVFMIVCLLGSGMALAAEPGEDKIIDVFDKHVAVKASGALRFGKGDWVGLVCQDKKLETLVGIYEIIEIKGNVFVAREVDIATPAVKGMKVRIDPASSQPAAAVTPEEVALAMKKKGLGPGAPKPGREEKGEGPAPAFIVQPPAEGAETATGAMDEPGRDPRFLEANQGAAAAAAGQTQAAAIMGKVKEVSGDKVRISFRSGAKPKKGFLAEIISRQDGSPRIVGMWEVTEVLAGEVLAAKLMADEEPRVDQEARMYDPAAIPEPDGSGLDPESEE